MNAIWKQILNEIKRISPDIYNTINKPAEIQQIMELNKFLGCNLPQSFIDFFLVFNGQSEKGIDFSLIGNNRFLPIAEIIKTIEQQDFLFGGEEPISHIKENKIKPVFWNNLWVPFADCEVNTRLILDLDAGKNGTNGQVIQLWSGIDYEDDVVVSNSFEEFSKELLSRLKNNEFKLENDTIEFEDYWII